MEQRKLKIALLGLEQHIGGVINDIETAQFVVHSIPLKGTERISDFDSVMIFQGAFEQLCHSSGYCDDSYWITCDKDELDRRLKEIVQLRNKGGFVLVILTRPFYDVYGDKRYKSSDLSKILSNTSSVNRFDLPEAMPLVQAMTNELISFCEKYGRAYSYFDCYSGAREALDFFPLAKIFDNKVVGMSLYRTVYYIPALLPKSFEWEEFIKDAVTPIVSIHKKRRLELPRWVNDVLLGQEDALRKELSKSEDRIKKIKEQLATLSRFKRVLIETGDDLVHSVSLLLRETTDFVVDSQDDKKEDCRLRDKSGNVIALIEIKGINGNAKMSNVSQAFEHRERTPGCENLPAILIANTFIGTARSEEEKDKAPEAEQVALAERHDVLVLRTLDLLRMYNSVLLGQVKKEDIASLLLTKVGWLDWKNVVDT